MSRVHAIAQDFARQPACALLQSGPPSRVRRPDTVVSHVVQPIGYVRSALKLWAETPGSGGENGAPEAWLELRTGLEPALEGLAVGDGLLVLTWQHEARRDLLRVPARGQPARPPAGVFATGVPDRPNPVGLHRVKVLAIDGTRLRVGPLEACNGTPVIDLRPEKFLTANGPAAAEPSD